MRRTRFAWSANPAGYTLTELVVVIGLIAVLMAMLIPALVLARRSAAKLVCASNLHQWALAANQYALEFNNFLPRRGQGQHQTSVINRPEDWFNSLPLVMKKQPCQDLVATGRMPRVGDGGLWICPQANDLPNGSGVLFTYGMNMRLSTWQTALPDRIDKVGQPDTMVFMADGPSGYCSVLPFAGLFSPVARHGGQVNLAFLDGHVASFPGKYIGCGIGDPLLPEVRWIVPGSSWAGPTP